MTQTEPWTVLKGVAADASCARKVLLNLARRLGKPHAYSAENNGSIIQEIKPTIEDATLQTARSFRTPLYYHTENAFMNHRPDYVLLMCRRQGLTAVPTNVIATKDIVASLDDLVVKKLSTIQVLLDAPPSFTSQQDATLGYVIEHDGMHHRLRLNWRLGMRCAAQCLCDELDKLVATIHDLRPVQITMDVGDVLILDNRYCVHGRDEFDAYLDGSDRWLDRAYVILS